jgi:hypothetical protein
LKRAVVARFYRPARPAAWPGKDEEDKKYFVLEGDKAVMSTLFNPQRYSRRYMYISRTGNREVHKIIDISQKARQVTPDKMVILIER